MRLPEFLRFLAPRGARSAPVRYAGRDVIEVREGERVVKLYAELQNGPVARIIHHGSIRGWEPPHERETFDEAARERCLKAVTDFLDSRGVRYEIV